MVTRVTESHPLAKSADRMPDATLVTIDAGHYVHSERPEELLAPVDGFLARRTPH